MKQIKDGWHTIAGYTVYVEGGKILRGLSKDKQRTEYPYRKVKDGWTMDAPITPDAFRAGLNRGTIKME